MSIQINNNKINSAAQNVSINLQDPIPREESTSSAPTANENVHPLLVEVPLQLSDKEILLEKNQKIILDDLLKKSYAIPGNKGTPTIHLDLFQFLKDLYTFVPNINIMLIGSAAGHVMNPQPTGYNDVDFLIQMQIKIEKSQLKNKTYINNFIKTEVDSYAKQIRAAIQSCLAKQTGSTLSVVENYFNTHICINSQVNWDQLSSSGNRCSIIGLGELEWKTEITICICEEGENTTLIPGLKNASAFNRDDLKICLLPDFLHSKEMLLFPLRACSTHVPIKTVLSELKSKELHTSHSDGNCIKGNDNITYKGCSYPDQNTNRKICTHFLQDSKNITKLENNYQKHKDKHPLGALCALINFYINSTNLKVTPQLTQPFYEKMGALLINHFPELHKKIPENLLLNWCYLTLFLSATPASHSPQLLIPHSETPYYLLKSTDIIDLLHNFIKLLNQYPEIKIEDLPTLGIKFQNMEQLFLKMQPLLQEEQLISFYHFLLAHFPSHLMENAEDFHRLFPFIIRKMKNANYNSDEINELINTFSQFEKTKPLPDSIKEEIKDALFNACSILESRIETCENETEKKSIIDTIKACLAENITKRVVSYLRSSPHGLALAKEFLDAPFFSITLIEEMKQGTLENNIEWFNLLHDNNLLSIDDEKSWECCGTLLSQWQKNPSLKFHKQVVSALNFLNNALKKKEKNIPTALKEQASGAYTNFVEGCIKSQEQVLLQAVREILFSNIRSILPLTPENLVLSWCYLTLFLSETPAPHSEATCYILKSSDIIDLLYDFINLLNQHPEIKLEELPTLSIKFQNMEQLFLKIQPLLQEDQLISFYHFLLTHFPSHLRENAENVYRLFPFIIRKTKNSNYNPDEIKELVNIFSQLEKIKPLPDSIKEEINNEIFNACSILESRIETCKNETEKKTIIDTIKACLAENVTKRGIISYLRSSPRGLALAKELLDTPFFSITLIEEMKQGSLENNIEWFNLLHHNNLLSIDDEKSWECCGTLLCQWQQNPSLKFHKQVISALNFLNNALKKKEKNIPTALKEQASDAYTNFVEGCIKSQEQALLQAAREIIFSNIKSILPLTIATLFSQWIDHVEINELENLLTQAINQKMLTEKYPEALVNSYYFITKKLISKKYTKLTAFIESSLNNKTLINALIKSTTPHENNLIIQLIYASQTITATNPISENLILLFEKLHKNVKTNNCDLTFIQHVRKCTVIILTNKQINESYIRAEKSINILTKDMTIFRNHEKDRLNLLSAALIVLSSNYLEFIKKNHKKNNEKEKIDIILNSFEKYDKIKTNQSNYDEFNNYYVLSLIYTNLTEKAISKISKTKDLQARLMIIESAMMEIKKYAKEGVFKIEQELMFIEILKEYFHKDSLSTMAALEKTRPLDYLTSLASCTCALIPLADNANIHKNIKEEIIRFVSIIENIIKTNPNQQKHNRACCDILNVTCDSKTFIGIAVSLLNHAKKYTTIDKKSIDIFEYTIENNSANNKQKDYHATQILSMIDISEKRLVYANSKTMETFIDMLSECCKPQKINNLFDLNSFYQCLLFFIQAPLNNPLSAEAQKKTVSLIEILQKALQSNQGKPVQNALQYYEPLLKVLCLHPQFYPCTFSLLTDAIKTGIIKEDSDLCKLIKDNLVQTMKNKKK